MANDVKVVIKAILNDKDFRKTIKGITNDTKKFNTETKKTAKLKKGLTALKAAWIAVGAVITGVVAKSFVKLIKKASDFEEQNAKFMVVFRGVEKAAIAMRDELVSAYGMSRLEATKSLSTMQDFLVPMGIARDRAADLSGEFAKLAVDMGSFNNVPTAQTMDAIKSALAGMSRPLRQYGVDVSELTLKNMALAQGIKLTNGVLDRESRAMLVLQKVQEDSADAMGDFARTQSSFANQSKILSARFEDMSVNIGQKLMPIAAKFIAVLNEQVFVSRDLKDITDRVISASKRYNTITKELEGSVGDLSDAERKLKEGRQALAKSDLINEVVALDKAYRKQQGILSNTDKALKLVFGETVSLAVTTETLEKRTKTWTKAVDFNLIALQKLQAEHATGNTKAKERLLVTQKDIDGRLKQGEILGNLSAATLQYRKALAGQSDATAKETKRTGGLIESKLALADALREQMISMDDLKILAPELQAQIIALSKVDREAAEAFVESEKLRLAALEETAEKARILAEENAAELKRFEEERLEFLAEGIELEIIQETQKFETLFALAEKHNQDTAELTKQHEKNLEKIREKANKKNEDAYKSVQKAKLKAATMFTDSVLMQFQKEGEGFKGVLSDMIKGFTTMIAGQLAAMAAKNLTNPFTAGIGVAQLAAAVTVKSIGSQISGMIMSFETGTENVPQDMKANLHAGERIIPASQNIPSVSNDDYTRAAMRGLEGGQSIENTDASTNDNSITNNDNRNINIELPDATIQEVMEQADMLNSNAFTR